MADNDDRSIPYVAGDKDGKPQLRSLNEIVRQIFTNFHKLEGRIGEITLRDSLRVPVKLTLEGDEEPDTEESTGIIYFDEDEAIFKVSEDGGEFVPLVSGGFNACMAEQTGGFNVNSGVAVTPALNTTLIETLDGMHDNATNNSRITTPISGIYSIGIYNVWAANAVGSRTVAIYKNGGATAEIANVIPTALAGSSTAHSAIIIISLTAGDYIEGSVDQNSGGVLAALRTKLWMNYLGAS